MSETLVHVAPLTCWRGDRGTYHLVTIDGEVAEAIEMHERLHRLEFGKRRGFGSVKVVARIGGTRWKTSVFPVTSTSPGEGDSSNWWLLVGRKVMKAEGLAEGDTAEVELALL